MAHTSAGGFRGIAKRLERLCNRNARIYLPLNDSIARANEYRHFTEIRLRHTIP